MGVSIPYNHKMDFAYGQLQAVTPQVRRLVCNNPSPFTFYGTNTYVIGHGEVTVVDPGPAVEEHVDALLSGLGSERVKRVLVTHTHRDHSPAAAELKARTGATVMGYGPHGEGRFERGAEVEAGGDLEFQPEVTLRDGDIVEGGDHRVVTVHTPGHCSNHLCFEVEGEGSLLTGDHVMGWSTSVISPPDGDMGEYLASLRKLLARSDQRYLPAHGAAIESPHSFVEAFIEHRADRERQLLTCIDAGISHIRDMVVRMYQGVPEHLHPAAARSVLAHALHLLERGDIACAGAPGLEGHWTRAAAS